MAGGERIVILKGALHKGQRQQFSSVILFVSVIVLINLCSFSQNHQYLDETNNEMLPDVTIMKTSKLTAPSAGDNDNFHSYYLSHIETCLKFFKLMFSNPMRLDRRTMKYTQAEARVLGKVAKVWYIKKKIKKLSKKLKKHTIAVPVFTAIPIYEHSYYPQPHVSHVTHGSMHHHAAASSYVPAVAQLTTAASAPVSVVTSGGSPLTNSQQLATSASNNHQVVAYRMAPNHGSMYHHHPSMHHHHHPAASAHQIINAYAPSPPLYVDEAGGLYGHYGNAYGRYDGGYQFW